MKNKKIIFLYFFYSSYCFIFTINYFLLTFLLFFIFYWYTALLQTVLIYKNYPILYVVYYNLLVLEIKLNAICLYICVSRIV